MEKATPVPAAEAAKAASHYLRGTLREELAQDEPAFSKPAVGILKFHGIYQQDDRDLRKASVKKITAMVRVGVPGGVLTPQQYLALDRIADLGEGSLRITTRQDIQYHYVPKGRLRELIRTLNENWLSTLAACGDVVRNVVSCPAPFESDQRRDLFPYVSFISKQLKPKTTSYYEVWLDGEKALTAEEPEGEVEPLYGQTYLPRKFKIAFAFPGDNTTDMYANDIGIVPHYEAGAITGFTILAGGGMGQSAGVKASHPRLAEPVCSIGASREELLQVCEAIVSIHRDFGNRTNRKLARLKYVLDAWGVEKFKQELNERVGHPLAAPKPLEWYRAEDYLGWQRQGSDAAGNPVWFVGVRIISGRVKDFDSDQRIRTGLRTAVERYRPGVRLTAQQNVYLTDISDADRPAIAALLAEHGIQEPETLPPVLRHAMSCPALPTCGLAITESERILPQVVAEVQEELNRAGLPDQIIHLRTTGCPNGCARPYTAEIGIVGASIDMYTIYLGASVLGTRLGSAFATNVKRDQIVELLRPVFAHYRDARLPNELFGDFCHRLGIEALRELSQMAAA
ncbi:MAG TPA: NADPH-dependent assimilatory sulfite reductase hemoprotein subunit [Bryobacteraceae bacterium]|jgi:sulfite reductase (ferredoxin)|nr:NADPH-dependent assimilatory sulfite reductase hemoprotein subunit [Bryobacteraceae bacterium]